MRKYLIIIISITFLATNNTSAQYDFKEVKKVTCSEIKNQARTGTCWSFATSSFLESELAKQGRNLDLSEMYIVRKVYENKALNYVLRQGKANFSQGSLSHDLIKTFARDGIVLESDYQGLTYGSKYNHSEMEKVLKGMLDGVLAGKSPSPKWRSAISAVLDIYMGSTPETFFVDGVSHNATSFSKSLGLNAHDYISLSSFTHHPFYTSFILEIPDNYSNGQFYNVPIEELKNTVDHALDQGYSIAWDGDVSEEGFSHKNGIAILPVDEKRTDLFENPGPEVSVNQTNRQEHFESFSTTDDHLMHLVGTAKDAKGNKYYIIKNSWGDKNTYQGYLYMSEAYFLMKTVAIMINKNAIDKTLRNKISFSN